MRVFYIGMLLLITTGDAFAQKAQGGFYLDQSFGGALQPSGAQSATKFYRRIPLYNKSGILWEASRIDLGLDNRLTPSYEVPFVFASVSPIAFLDFRARAGYMRFYRGLGYGFTPLASYSSGYSASQRSGLHRENRGGLWSDLASSVRAALGSAVFVHTFTVNYVSFGSRGFFYEPYQDVVMKCTDHSFIHHTIAVWRFTGLAAGAEHFLIHVPGSGYVSESFSALAAWSKVMDERFEIYAGAKSGIYLQNRYYRHELTAAAWFGMTMRLE